jgi:hypothetical protein
MEPIELVPKNSQRQGIPLWAALAALLVLAVSSIAVLAYVLNKATNDKARLEKQAQNWELEKAKVEIDRQKATEQAKLAVARTRQTDALSQVRVATNACGQLLLSLAEFEREAAALRTSDAGRQVARHPDLVTLARRLYEVDMRDLPKQPMVISKLEGERRLESQIVAAAGTGFEPDSALTSTAQTDTIWANQEASKVQRARALVATLIDESRIKLPPADSAGPSITLADAMLTLSRREAVARQQLIVEKTSAATTTGSAAVASAEAEKILTEAKVKAARIIEEAKALKDKQEREQLVRNAERKVAAEEATDEALKVKLRAKAKDPKIQAKLAPFTTPGYVQFGSDSYDKAPISYSGLMQYGALNPSKTGLQKLATIAKSREDKVRPRWHFRIDQPSGWDKTTSDREMVTEAQQLLIELGPTLVEMGLLQK